VVGLPNPLQVDISESLLYLQIMEKDSNMTHASFHVIQCHVTFIVDRVSVNSLRYRDECC
jgi:hypothetical protein